MIGQLKKLTIQYWDGDLPEFGDVMFTAAGSRYIVHSIRPTRGKAPKSLAKLEVIKLAQDDEEPDNARRFEFHWCSRARK